jgi:hypothetical protein
MLEDVGEGETYDLGPFWGDSECYRCYSSSSSSSSEESSSSSIYISLLQENRHYILQENEGRIII